jgi:hypothetical protein
VVNFKANFNLFIFLGHPRADTFVSPEFQKQGLLDHPAFGLGFCFDERLFS